MGNKDLIPSVPFTDEEKKYIPLKKRAYMKEKIEKLINVFKGGKFDQEAEHIEYDQLLETFILNYDPELLPLMKELIELEKNFWYA